jgi:hypothetical protein
MLELMQGQVVQQEHKRQLCHLVVIPQVLQMLAKNMMEVIGQLVGTIQPVRLMWVILDLQLIVMVLLDMQVVQL